MKISSSSTLEFLSSIRATCWRTLRANNLRSLVLTAFFLTGCEVGFGPGIQDFSLELPDGSELLRNSEHKISIEGFTEIPAKVVEMDYDNKFLIVKQQELQSRSANVPNSYLEPIPGAFHFWISNLETSEVYGPLTNIEFMRMREERERQWWAF